MTKKVLINEGLGVRQPAPTASNGVGAGVGPRQPSPQPSTPRPGK